MKRRIAWGAAILIFALACGVAAFVATRSHRVEETHEVLLDDMPELSWLRDELDLSDEQFAKVRQLHVGYRPKCVVMCRRIREAHERLDAASRGEEEVTPELKAAIEDHARLHAECQQAMLEHLYETAAVLDDDQARRYIETMLPYALDFSHSEPEGMHER
jgi:hypothetical protein